MYLDSDILIWHLRGEKKALRFLQKLSVSQEYELWIGVLQRAEIVFFMRPEEDDMTMLFLSQFRTATIDKSIVDKAGKIYRIWHPSHGIGINDAFLAATVMQTGGQIYTQNLKHYPMPDLIVKQAWK